MKRFLSLLLIFIIAISSITCIFASENLNNNYNTVEEGASSESSSDFDPIKFGPKAPGGGISTATEKIIGTMKWFGYAIAVGMLVYIGIKYVMASADGKADLKSAIVKYVIGTVIILFAVNIAEWVFNVIF